jgi:diguanylate cyclase (GGDEF)-like protein
VGRLVAGDRWVAGGWFPVRPWQVTRWDVWRLPRRVVAAALVVDGLALVLVASQSVVLRPTARDAALTVVLILFGIVHTEVVNRVERLRRRVTHTSYYDLSSVWTFASAVLLPLPLAAVVVAAVYLHLWVRVWRPARSPAYRTLYTTAAVVLAVQAAHAVVAAGGGPSTWTSGAGGLAELAAAVLAYAAVNNLLVVGVIALDPGPLPAGRRARVHHLLGPVDDLVLEIATLSLGALTAMALDQNPWLVVLVLLPLVVLHRAVATPHLEQRAATDAKTGLLNAASWHEKAERALRSAQRHGDAAGVLILDLDHFKAVNDTYGHLAGDDVLVAVAATLRTEVRERDVVGRFGGEEFVVLVRDLPLTSAGRRQLERVAERIRARVAQLVVAVSTPDGPLTISGLTTSVGAVFHLGRTSTLQQVLGAADAALYAAKRDGRNLVRFGPAPTVPGLSSS